MMKKFSSFCKKCKINLCLECEFEHKDKGNIVNFRDLLHNKDNLKNNLNSLGLKINEYKDKINEIKKLFDNLILNLEMAYKIGDNLLKNYEKKKRNYQSLINISEIEKFNNKLTDNLNKIIENNDIIDFLIHSFDLIDKFGIQYDKNIISFNKIKNIASNMNNSNNINEATDSKIMLNDNYIEKIKDWIKPKKISSFTLLYRLTRDGANPKSFHDKCDKKGPTLVLVETNKGCKFGGYTPLDWESPSKTLYKEDDKTFLFSLNKMKKYNKITSGRSIFIDAKYGPGFGEGCDFLIFYPSYNQGQGTNGNYLSEHELTNGEKTFTLKEVEIFKVNFN